MSVQNEIYFQELVAAYKTLLSQKINFNVIVPDIKAAAEAIKLMPLYDSEMTTEEKVDIEKIITVTTGLIL